VVEEIAVALLLDVAAAGDDVERDASAGEVVERGGLARGERRRDEARPVGDEVSEPVVTDAAWRRHHETVGAGRAVADQHEVEAAVPRARARTAAMNSRSTSPVMIDLP